MEKSKGIAESELRILLHALKSARNGLEECEKALTQLHSDEHQVYRKRLERRRHTWQNVIEELTVELETIDPSGAGKAPSERDDVKDPKY